jgi:hypothetical protein
MAYVTRQARENLLAAVADAIDEIGVALAALGAAYDRLDEAAADRLEEQLFRPVQVAYGRAQRTHAGFAQRHGLAGRTFAAASAGPVSQGVRELLDRAVDAVDEADEVLADLQNSMRPVEVGDAELRAGLAQVRALLGDLRGRSRELVRTLGR